MKQAQIENTSKKIACLHTGRVRLCNCVRNLYVQGYTLCTFSVTAIYWSPTGHSVFTRGECVRFSALQFHSYLDRMPVHSLIGTRHDPIRIWED